MIVWLFPSCSVFAPILHQWRDDGNVTKLMRPVTASSTFALVITIKANIFNIFAIKIWIKLKAYIILMYAVGI